MGACIAVIAAILTWLNVSRQIRASRLTAERLESTAFRQISAELRDVIELLNLCWRALDSTLKPAITNEKCKTGKAVIIAISHQVSKFVLNSDFTTVVKDLNHIQRRQFSDVWRALSMTVDHVNGKSDFEGHAFLWLQTLRTQLSHFEIYLRTFNPTLADIFDGRKKANIDSRPLASHLEELVEKYEKTGTI